jgi:hypothetical protein
MDEHLASKNSDPSENIQEMLKTTLESDEWRALSPNLPSPGHDLLPQEVGQEQLGLIIDAVKDLPLPADSKGEITERTIDLGEAGTLAFVGHGESKLCFQLEKGGKKMAVIVQGYQSQLGAQIPQDPHLTKITDTLNGAVWEYSGLRTYAMLPLPDNKAVRLQEFGEPTGGGLRSVASSLRGALSRRTVTNYIAEHVPGAKLGQGTNTDLELQQSRHLLTKPGHSKPVFIDIPVMQQADRLLSTSV